ncbi:MAG: hypothetical protein RL538_94 [Candidatus Parcubacteria bacterium]
MAKMMAEQPFSEQRDEVEKWKKWMDSHSANFLDEGNPVGKNTRIKTGGGMSVPNEVGGYSIITADSMDDAVELLKNSPHLEFQDSYIEVMEIIEAM